MSISVVVKWAGKEYNVENIDPGESVMDLKVKIMNQTGVRPERQKLLNLKVKGKAATDEMKIGSLGLKDNFKLMMMGSLEETIIETQKKPENLPEVINDLDIEEDDVAVQDKEINLDKIAKRVRDYEVKVLNPSRENMKLLVLDIDYTLFDHRLVFSFLLLRLTTNYWICHCCRSVAETGWELMRPYLHEFLETAYQHYDIAIWYVKYVKVTSN